MSVLSNLDVQAICDYLDIPLIGVFPKNKLPSIKREGYYIINLDSSTGEGTHWVAIYISNKKNRSFYWDSFGVPYAPKLVKKYIQQFKPYYSNEQLQALEGTYCGWYAIAICYWHHINQQTEAKDLIEGFNHHFFNPNTNYSRLVKFFEDII
jgi:hypothetical protein